MAISYKFGSRKIKIPGAYSRIKSGIQNPPATQDFGTGLIVDNGNYGATWGGGSGSLGTLDSGKKAIYSVQTIDDFKGFWKGGVMHTLAEALFRPAGRPGIPGASIVYLIRGATTAPAEATFNPTGGGAAGGEVVIQARDEGLVGNGSEDADDILRKGFAFTMEAGVDDTDKFILKFWRGTYAGKDSDNIPYDREEQNSPPLFLTQSPEFDNIAEVIAWMTDDAEFNDFFKLKSSDVTGTGVVDSADLSTFSGNTLFADGTETFSAEAMDAALEAADSLNVRFVLAPDDEDDAQSADNTKLWTFIKETNKFHPQMYVGGGGDSTKFDGGANSTQEICEHFDDDHVSVPHGRPLISSRHVGVGHREMPTIYKAAILLGREAGKEPQVPLTFKSIGIDGEKHELSDRDIEKGLEFGALMTAESNGVIEVVFAVNSRQANNNMVNEDDTTPIMQIRRIARQINAELIVNIKNDLQRDENGVNRNTLSPDDYAAYIKNYLKNRTAQGDDDNLILGFEDVQVTVDGLAYFVTYRFIPNFEVAFLFSTGFMIDPQ